MQTSTTWVGRKRELRALAELTLSDAAAIGVIGPAGIGKSRLLQRILDDGRLVHLALGHLGSEVEELLDALPRRYVAELRSLEGQAHALASRLREDGIEWLALDFERFLGGSLVPFVELLNREGIRVLFCSRERPEFAHVPLRLGPLTLPMGAWELLNDESQAAALFRDVLAREGLQTLLQIEHAPQLVRHLEATGGVPERIIELGRILRVEGIHGHVLEALQELGSQPAEALELDAVEREVFDGLRLRATAWSPREAHDLLSRLGALETPCWWWDQATATLHGPLGEQIPLEGKERLRSVFEVLLQAGPRGVDVATLLRRGWPDERLSVERGRSRVYMAISNLRKAGLSDLVVQDGNNYRLASRVGVRKTPPSIAELLVRLEDRGLSFSDMSIGRGTYRVVTAAHDLSLVPEKYLAALADSLGELCADPARLLREPEGQALRETLDRISLDLRRLARAIFARRDDLDPHQWARIAPLFGVWAEHLLGSGSLQVVVEEVDLVVDWLDSTERPAGDLARSRTHVARAWEMSGRVREAESRYARASTTDDEDVATRAEGGWARCRVRRGEDVDVDVAIRGLGDEARRQRLMTCVLRDNLREAHDEALRGCDALIAMASTTADVLEANAVRAVMLAEVGRIHEALPELDEVVEGYRRIGDRRRAQRFEAIAAYVALAAGQLERAAAALLRISQRLEFCDRVEVARNRAFLAVAMALLGAQDDAAREARRARELAADCEHVGIRAFVDAQIALMHAAGGDEVRMVAYLERARSQLSEGSVTFAHEVVAIVDAARRNEWPEGGALLGHATRALCRRIFGAQVG